MVREAIRLADRLLADGLLGAAAESKGSAAEAVDVTRRTGRREPPTGSQTITSGSSATAISRRGRAGSSRRRSGLGLLRESAEADTLDPETLDPDARADFGRDDPAEPFSSPGPAAQPGAPVGAAVLDLRAVVGDASGAVVGVHRFLGTLTVAGAERERHDIPVLRRRVRRR